MILVQTEALCMNNSLSPRHGDVVIVRASHSELAYEVQIVPGHSRSSCFPASVSAAAVMLKRVRRLMPHTTRKVRGLCYRPQVGTRIASRCVPGAQLGRNSTITTGFILASARRISS